ncbi:MAG TPA: UDP-N-acetylmuramoyl-L-alanyl-D-glutamate--2,6-diaminopimelate ligase, partial [Candidatus Gallibacteroides avistercoris]|nr:UDP-N-acetylmuramoyl-L-alanyl-D-glutamate--2,6-diaminopimelate ligase [Candidatus Gallibacteroides avistercoris]
IGKEAIAATHTTPDPFELNYLLGRMVEAGCRHAFMEVSSHSVDQKRIAGLRFKGGIFTNLTRDHLDYHKTVEAYLKAKKGFFDALPADAFALTNGDDKNGRVMLQNTAAAQYTYSLRGMADFKGRILESHFDGTELEINNRQLFVRFVGRFNAYNLLAVYGAATLLGMDKETLLVNMSRLIPVSGRFQTLRSPNGFTAIVDYAHTPDAIKNILTAVHEVLNAKGKVISVVGAGGNRDKGKRPLMAQETVAQSDRVILTSDNPRFEQPEAIIDDMLQGLTPEQQQKVLTITDRRQAIKTAVMLAQPGDVVVVAGKGHEDYQEIQGVKHHFNDKEEIEALFAQMQ